MPMLDRVQVSNKFGGVSKPKSNLNVFFWNAERGTDWKDLSTFAKDPDILILNELDWGMARSGNTHTAQLLSDELKMNYAYGVEFLELTNGNAKEINATHGQTNEVGYHGNVVMSKWPIVETKVTRLHQLYEHLYKSKGVGQDSGERRLGGRMAMYARTRMAEDRDMLVVAMHGHGGSKRNKLQEDARTICADIKSFSNITAVFVGGDMAGVLANTLRDSCAMLPLNETNNFRGKRPTNTWRVECPNGEKPRARFERGDWLVASGAIMTKEDSINTIHPFRKLPEDKYECISDHSMIEFTAILGGDSYTTTATA